MKTLIIGGWTDGIGDELHDLYSMPRNSEFEQMYKPKREELDVRDQQSIMLYVMNHGPFDEIVYSAGVSQLKWMKDIGWRDLDRVYDVNVAGAILLAAAHVERFPEHPVRYAVVVSDAAHTPMRGSIAYTTSKAALEMAVRNMAREMAPLWTVVGVSPGVVEGTGMTRELAEKIPEFRGWTEDQAREYEGLPPIGRRVTKREVADTLWFALKGPEALNGSIITINGGK